MIFLYLFLGLAPGIIWLLFFLREDVHPESNRMIILVFLLGMAIAPLVAFLECLPRGFDSEGKLICAFSSFFSKNFPFPLNFFLYTLLAIALIEEFAKYLVVRLKVLNDPEFDEPIDAMLYMIIAALGFATVENILILFLPGKPLLIKEASVITSFRFIGATFLHALASGTIGYFLARSLFEPKRKEVLLFVGFSLAILLHSLFNFSIMMVDQKVIQIEQGFSVIVVILIFLAVFVAFAFQNLKKLASICLPDLPSATRRQAGKIQ